MASERLSNIAVLMQKRLDLLLSLVQVVKKYNLHEHTTFEDTISARQFNANAPPHEQVKQLSDLQDNLVKINALIEAYPTLKADNLHAIVMTRNNELEYSIQQERLKYNGVVRDYNTFVKTFPSNLVAKHYRFNLLGYLTFTAQERYEPRKIYEEA
jgi:LemA protein